MAVELYPRSVERLIADEILPTFAAVLLVGPRGSGKSTSMSNLADTVLDLSEPGIRLAATEDPDGILASATGRVLIDEWQEAPDILGAIKRAVDKDSTNEPGRFIVTGSVRAAQQSTTWPGTGRLIRIRMHGLTQAELLHDNIYNPIDAFFNKGQPNFGRSDLSRTDYLNKIVAGRFPIAVDLTPRNRSRWYSAYIEQLVERDMTQLTMRSPHSNKLRSVLSSCAALTAQPLKKAATAKDAVVDIRTADNAIELLEDLSIILRIPAWHEKRLKRLTQSPKIHLTDPGMAAYLLNSDAESLGRDPKLVGQLFETFVVAELITHIETTQTETRLFHARDRDGNEVDAILEQNGRIVALEVKSSTKVSRSDANGLIWLRDRIGTEFHYGAVLYTGSLPFQLDDRIWALPIDSLWQSPR